ncbi:MAG: amino acid--[acyl-carrier-protein] ligase [Solirubrobacteraceae bacterium]
MPEVRQATADQAAFRDELIARGLFIDSGVPGLYGRGATFEDIRGRVDAVITQAAQADAPESMRFPPLLPRRQIETIGYLHSFPHLAGSVFAFEGGEEEALLQGERADRHEDWSEFQRMTALALVPAACYPVYPAVAARGPLPAGGTVVDAGGAWVFRHEPSEDPARMQMFHQREIVSLGAPEEVRAWRDRWSERGLTLLRSLGLDAQRDRATDPFFGRGGRMLAANQRTQELKLELLVGIAGDEPTAVASFNYHQDHFAAKYGLTLADGGAAHTACLGFGQERIVLALLHTHGLEPASWPAEVRRELWGA